MVLVLLLAPVEAFPFQPKGASELALSKPIDLLAMVKLPENVMRGSWTGRDVLCPGRDSRKLSAQLRVHSADS